MSKLSELTDLVTHTQAEQSRDLASLRFRALLMTGPVGGLTLAMVPGYEGVAAMTLAGGIGLALAWAGASFFIVSDTYATPEIMRMVGELNVSHVHAHGRLLRQFKLKGRVPLSAVQDYLRAETRMRATEKAYQAVEQMP